MTTTAIIDGDSIVYACAFAYDASTERNGVEEPIANLYGGVKATIESLLREVGATQYELFLTGQGNFRDSVYPEYKGNRKDSVQPTRKHEVRDYMIRHKGAMVVDGMEADDACGMAMYALPVSRTVLIRQDKDFDMIRGNQFHWHKAHRANGIFNISEIEADRNLYRQILKGDSTDNIPGLFKLTGKKATKAVMAPLDTMVEETEMYDYCLEQYEGNRATMEMLCKLLYIWRDSNGWVCPHHRLIPVTSRS